MRVAHIVYAYPSILVSAAGLYCSIGDTFLPPSGACWSVLLIWAAAHVGGLLVHRVELSVTTSSKTDAVPCMHAHITRHMHTERHGARMQVVPQLPPLLGMLVAGIVLRNIPSDLVRGLQYSWTKELRYGCLAINLLMSGLEQDLRVRA